MECGEGPIPAQTVNKDLLKKSEGQTSEEIIDFRFKQTYDDRLCEYLTGLRLNDSELPNRLAVDQKIIREKYGLPKREYRFNNPSDYENYLRELAKNNDVDIRETSDCGKFFDENKMAGGVYLQENKTIGVDIDKSSKKNYFTSLGVLEHETIHSLQNKYYPKMPIEQQEYEAFAAGSNTEYLKEHPDAIELFFSFSVYGSVNHYYRSESEERGEKN